MKRLVSVALAIFLAATLPFVFAACGDKTSNGKANGAKVINIHLSEETYAFAVNKSDTELLSKVNEYLAKIKSDGTFDAICNRYFGDGTPVKVKSAELNASKDQLVVATSTGFEPFEMVENGEYFGIDMEIAAGLAAYLGKELVIQDMVFESVVTSVQSGLCDIGMAGLSITPAREEIVTFSDSYYNASQVLIVKDTDTRFDSCKTVDDVVAILEKLDKSTKIGCQKGTTGETYIDGDLDMGDDGYGFKGLPVTKMSYDYGALAVTAMLNGEIDMVIIDNAPADAIVKSINK